MFLVKEGMLMTPPLSGGCLAGVTRALILELCVREAIPVIEKAIPFAALESAQEAFLTSTKRQVHAIKMVNGQRLDSVPGPLTRKLGRAFRTLAETEMDP